MLSSDNAIMWWYVFGSMICDDFSIWLSNWYNGRMIQIQLLVFWDLYIGSLQGNHVHTQIWFRTIPYTFTHMVD